MWTHIWHLLSIVFGFGLNTCFIGASPDCSPVTHAPYHGTWIRIVLLKGSNLRDTKRNMYMKNLDFQFASTKIRKNHDAWLINPNWIIFVVAIDHGHLVSWISVRPYSTESVNCSKEPEVLNNLSKTWQKICKLFVFIHPQSLTAGIWKWCFFFKRNLIFVWLVFR